MKKVKKRKIEWYKLNEQEVRAIVYDKQGKEVTNNLTGKLNDIKHYFTEDKFEYIKIEAFGNDK